MRSQKFQEVKCTPQPSSHTFLTNFLQAREYLHDLTVFYLDTLTSHPIYKKAKKKGMVDMPVHEDGLWHEVPITHIVPLWVRRPKAALYLAFHLTRDGFNGCNIMFPIVPKGEDRVRLFLHAHNTKDEVKALIDSITTWIQEMMDIEASGDKNKLPSAARLAFDLLEKDKEATENDKEAAETNKKAIENDTNGAPESMKPMSKDNSGTKNLMNGISSFKNSQLVNGLKFGELPTRMF